MSDKGYWGDKIIFTLHSDGIRRHKKWCKNYGEDGSCSALCGKCVGSAFCEHYKSQFSEEEPIYVRGNFTQACENKEDTATPSKPKLRFEEIYTRANWGDKLLNKTILIKTMPHKFRIGEVIEEEFRTFTVVFGEMKRKYDKRICFRNNTVYIFNELKITEEQQ